MANSSYHVVKVNDVSKIEISSAKVNGEPRTNVTTISADGRVASVLLNKRAAIELITAVAETAGIEKDVVRLYIPITDEQWAEKTR